MAIIVQHPAVRRTRRSPAPWPAPQRLGTLLAVIAAGVLALGSSWGVADAFALSAAPGGATYVSTSA